MCRLFQAGTNRLEDLAPGRSSFVHLGAKRRTHAGDSTTASNTNQALDCWCHGVTHLLSALGPEAALSLMARTVVDLVDMGTDTAAVPRAPHPG